MSLVLIISISIGFAALALPSFCYGACEIGGSALSVSFSHWWRRAERWRCCPRAKRGSFRRQTMLPAAQVYRERHGVVDNQ